MKLTIVTEEAVVYEGEIDQATFPTQMGQITVLAGHIPLVALVVSGEVTLVINGKPTLLAVSAGILEVRKNNELVLMADRSEFAHTIDKGRAEEAYSRAKKLLEEKTHEGDVDFARFESQIEKELNRVRVADKYIRHNP